MVAKWEDDLNEEDRDAQVAHSRVVEACARQVFPGELVAAQGPLRRSVAVASMLNHATRHELVRVVDATLGALYTAVQGSGWQTHKHAEMEEPGLVFVWYTAALGDVAAFCSFLVTNEEQVKVMYLYEIHVAPPYQGCRLGQCLMGGFHAVVERLHQPPLYVPQGSALTVFGTNKRALEWYMRLGYVVADHSPQGRVLRGRQIPPDYYILFREAKPA